MSERILKSKETAERAGFSRRTMYYEISEGRFPRPVQLTPKRVGWLESEIDEWIKAKVDRRDEVVG